jgi:hypothetical protein
MKIFTNGNTNPQATSGALRVVDLVAGRVPMVAPENMFYSTAPYSCQDSGGHTYVVKGPEPNIVAAEAVAYCLAPTFGIKTPDFALGKFDGESQLYFASFKLENAIRDVSPWLKKPDPAINEAMSAIHVFDVWLANIDRNLGGLLMRSGERGKELVSIDFEKSQAIHGPSPLIQVNTVNPKQLRPVGNLAKLPLPWKDNYAKSLSGIPEAQVVNAVNQVKRTMGLDFQWSESVIHTLLHRRTNIENLLKEVWS